MAPQGRCHVPQLRRYPPETCRVPHSPSAKKAKATCWSHLKLPCSPQPSCPWPSCTYSAPGRNTDRFPCPLHPARHLPTASSACPTPDALYRICRWGAKIAHAVTAGNVGDAALCAAMYALSGVDVPWAVFSDRQGAVLCKGADEGGKGGGRLRLNKVPVSLT